MAPPGCSPSLGWCMLAGWVRHMEQPCGEEGVEVVPAKTLWLSSPLVPACAAGGCLPPQCGMGC